MLVYVLTAEISGGVGDYDGVQSVHATMDGALVALSEWLDRLEIDPADARDGETESFNTDGARYVSFVGNDVTLANGPWGGAELEWGVNAQVVHGYVADPGPLSTRS